MPPQIRVPKGTNEALYVNVTDRLGQLLTLDTAVITYEIWDNETDVDQGNPELTGTCGNQDMTVITSPVDTSTLEEGTHRLFLNMVLGSEDIKLGPFPFIVG